MNHQSKTNSYTDFFYKAFRNILLVSVPLAIISAIILSSLHISATDSGSGTDSLTISISSACTLGSVVDTEHNTNTNVGTYTGDIGKTTITTLCNDGNGYAVYANGYSNNEEGNNKLINTEYPQYSIDTGLATSGLTSAWAIKLNNIPDDPSPTPPTIETDYNDTYGLVPSYWTKVASRASGTTDMDKGSSFTTTYAVYASSNQHAGTYVGQVKYMLTHPYSNDEYMYYMQEVETWKDTLALEESVQAIDMRDGKKYWVAKLKDGNIWMTQNLDFDINANTILNSNTTDLNAIYDSSTGKYAEYNYGYTIDNDIIYWAPASSATTIDFDNTAVIGWNSSKSAPASAEKTDSTLSGNYYNWTAAIASNNSGNLKSREVNPENSVCPKGWRLPAISGTTYGNEFAELNNSYNNNSTTSDTGLVAAPLQFTRSGYIREGTLAIYETYGHYWSSTAWSDLNAYNLYFSSSSVNVTGDGYDLNDGYARKENGRSIRCLAR